MLPRFHQTPSQLLHCLDGPSELTCMDALTAAGFTGTPKVLALDDESRRASAPSQQDVIIYDPSSSNRQTQKTAASLRERHARSVVALDWRSNLHDSATWVSVDLSQSLTNRQEVWHAVRRSRQTLLLGAWGIRREELASVLKEALHHGVRRWQMVILGASLDQQAEHEGSIAGSVPWVFV